MGEQFKICKHCKDELPLEMFSFKKDNGQYYRMGKCKKCVNHLRKPSSAKTRLKSIPENPEERKEYYKAKYEKYKATYKGYYEKVKKEAFYINRRSKTTKAYYVNNREKIRNKNREYESTIAAKERRKRMHDSRKTSDKGYVLMRRLRFRLRNALNALSKNNYKYRSAVDLLGCNMETFQKHIESLFSVGMNWSLVFAGEIHIDHVIPCAKYDLTKVEEQNKCFHYTNLQPLWGVDNLKKNSSYNGKFLRKTNQ